MNIKFSSSIFLLIALQLNFSLVQSRYSETTERDPYSTKWKVNSTNLFLDTGATMKTNKTERLHKGFQENSNLISNKGLNDKDIQESKDSYQGQKPNQIHMDKSQPTSKVDRAKNRESTTSEEESYTVTTAKYSSMDTSQKSYRTYNAALRNGESWPWGNSGRKSFSNDENNNLSTSMEEKSMSNSAHFLCKDQISKITILSSLLYISMYHIHSLLST